MEKQRGEVQHLTEQAGKKEGRLTEQEVVAGATGVLPDRALMGTQPHSGQVRMHHPITAGTPSAGKNT